MSQLAGTSVPLPVGGFTCARCGSWVPSGVSHSCWFDRKTQAAPTALKWDRTQEILDALAGLTAAVRELAERFPKP